LHCDAALVEETSGFIEIGTACAEDRASAREIARFDKGKTDAKL
jgi:hypothetical protein